MNQSNQLETRARRPHRATTIVIAAWLRASASANAKQRRHGCGSNLWLEVEQGNARWQLRFRLHGRPRAMGLGSCDLSGRNGVSLAEARTRAAEAMRLVRAGRDPISERQSTKQASRPSDHHAPVTFAQIAEQWLRDHSPGWRSAKHTSDVRHSLDHHILPSLGHLTPASITTEHVLSCVTPLWQSKPETASRVRARIEQVLDAAKVRGLRSGENPAAWRGHLALLLPKKAKLRRVQHHAALPWAQLPRFMAEAAQQTSTAWAAVRFAVLTATRSNEVRGCHWREIDLDTALWTIPANRMKAGREHRVPLSDAALSLLLSIPRPSPDALLFPACHGGQFTDAALRRPLRKTGWQDARGTPITLHGFRSTFRDWAGEATAHPREVIEHALAHGLPDATEAAYQRGDMLQKRRTLMSDWGRFCSEPPASVVPFLRRPA